MCPQQLLVKYMSKRTTFKTKVSPKILKTASDAFESSEANMLRIIAVYYSKGVMGKRKYGAVYRSLSMISNPKSKSKTTRIKVMSCPLPRLVPYNKLSLMLNEINVGTLYIFRDHLCHGLETGEKVEGCYRNLFEFLPRLASFYLSTLNVSDINWFNEAHTFQVAIGADGAPFGKFDQSCSCLISFLNIGHKVLRSEENFLILGSNCSETSTAVKRYISILCKEIDQIERVSLIP